jgi:hypothetical protein
MAKKKVEPEVKFDFSEIQKEFEMISKDKLLTNETEKQKEPSNSLELSQSINSSVDVGFQSMLDKITNQNIVEQDSDLFKVIDLMLDKKNVDKLTEINFPFKHTIVKLYAEFLASKKMKKSSALSLKLLAIYHLYMQSKERKSRDEFVKMKTTDSQQIQMNPFSNMMGANQPQELRGKRRF